MSRSDHDRRLRRLEAEVGDEPRGMKFEVHVRTISAAEARRMAAAEAARPRPARESMTDIEIAVIVPDPPPAA